MKFDFMILDFIQNNLQSLIADNFFSAITHLGDAGLIWIILAMLLLLNKKTRTVGIVVSVALLINMLFCNMILKPFFARIRPFDVRSGIQLLIAKPRDYSFPSGHTSASFTVFFALIFMQKKKLAIIVLPIACLIAFSRLYLYVHYPTDILGGIVVGVFSAWMSYIIYRYYHSFTAKID